LISAVVVCVTASAQPAPGGPPPNAAVAPQGATPPPIDPFLSKPLPANAPQPSSDPRNFDGVWIHQTPLEFQIRTDMFGAKAPFNAAGQKVMDRRLKSMTDRKPLINASTKCFPMGQPWQMDLNMPFQIFQSKDRLDLVFEEYHGAVQVFLNPLEAPTAPAYMGHSIAYWDGSTLVIETSGYEDGFWLDVNGTPASKNAKLIQRIRKVKTDHWFLEVVNTLDDPTYYTHPWSWVRDYSWRPDMTLFREYDCELQTGRKNGLDVSLVPEPQD
jgi:hypothetical protein